MKLKKYEVPVDKLRWECDPKMFDFECTDKAERSRDRLGEPKGEIQPIGGVNQKIEGFFQVCQAKGLTGDQGVLIPYQNLRNLMLREEVVEAVRGASSISTQPGPSTRVLRY